MHFVLQRIQTTQRVRIIGSSAKQEDLKGLLLTYFRKFNAQPLKCIHQRQYPGVFVVQPNEDEDVYELYKVSEDGLIRSHLAYELNSIYYFDSYDMDAPTPPIEECQNLLADLRGVVLDVEEADGFLITTKLVEDDSPEPTDEADPQPTPAGSLPEPTGSLPEPSKLVRSSAQSPKPSEVKTEIATPVPEVASCEAQVASCGAQARSYKDVLAERKKKTISTRMAGINRAQ